MNQNKILYIVRNEINTVFGGDTVQILKTKEYIENISKVKIDIITIDKFNSTLSLDYDIYHFWGIINIKYSLQQLQYLKENNKKIILSSIYWGITHVVFFKYLLSFFKYNTYSFYKYFCNLYSLLVLKPIASLLPKYKNKLVHVYGTKEFCNVQKQIVALCDIVIPNSVEEGQYLCKDIKLKYEEVANKFISIPNAVDIEYSKNHQDTGFMLELQNFVIEAAGIEPIKNQLNIIKSLYNHSEIPIVFAGGIRDEKYFNEVKKLAEKRGNVYFTGKINQDDLFSLYKRAKVHVLASFRESPGLATLEALMCGSQIVVSEEKYCPIKYYQFDKYGFVCNPYDVKSIKSAILNAYNNPKNIKLSEEYIKFFSYENVANMTYNVYERVLSEKQ